MASQIFNSCLFHSWLTRKRKCSESLLSNAERFYEDSAKRRRQSVDRHGNNVILAAATLAIIATPERKQKETWAFERSDAWWELGMRIWDDKEFKKRFRVKKDTFWDLVEELRPYLEGQENRFRHPIPVGKKVGVYLYRIGRGTHYFTIGDLFGLSEGACCINANKVAKLIVKHLYNQHVVLPSTDAEWETEMKGFLEQWGFPCVGSWDGCHVPINVFGNGKKFYNFKGFHSVGVMALVSYDRRFLYCATGAPGSAHDARTFRSTPLYQKITNGEILPSNCIVLDNCEIPFCFIADSAFPAHSWLIKPYSAKATSGEDFRMFNTRLSSARITCEHAFGMMKGRFRLFRKRAEVKPSTHCIWIRSGIALHNICLKKDDIPLSRWLLQVDRLHIIQNNIVCMDESRDLSEDTRSAIKTWICNNEPL